MCNSPDELAAALKRAIFFLLTTENNHCPDRGEAGLARTLRVLKEHGFVKSFLKADSVK
nr:CapA family protein [Paenibacillus vietnamensis]